MVLRMSKMTLFGLRLYPHMSITPKSGESLRPRVHYFPLIFTCFLEVVEEEWKKKTLVRHSSLGAQYRLGGWEHKDSFPNQGATPIPWSIKLEQVMILANSISSTVHLGLKLWKSCNLKSTLAKMGRELNGAPCMLPFASSSRCLKENKNVP